MADSNTSNNNNNNNNNAIWKNKYEATEIKVIWFYFYDKRFKEVCRLKEVCYTDYLFNKSMEKIKHIYSQYGPIEVKTYKLGR